MKISQPSLRWTGFSLVVLLLCGCGEPDIGIGATKVKRLSPAQYRQSVIDIFGPEIKLSGKFEPGFREDGLLAVGSGIATITFSGYEQFNVMGRSIAAHVVHFDNRDRLLPCQSPSADQFDESCARKVISHYGRLLFRRPLTEAEIDLRLSVATSAFAQLQDFYSGIEFALVSLLDSPNFLFISEGSEPDPRRSGAQRLDAYSKAARLSYLLWNTTPDDELLTAAEMGLLHSTEGLSRQVNRMLASARMETGIRAFFEDMLQFEKFETMAKDSIIYPKFSPIMATEMKEQTLKTIVDQLLTRDASYLELYTTPRTFLTRTLGYVYQLPVKTADGWEAYEFPPESHRRGLLSQLSFLAVHSHPTRSSATLRGKAMREDLLCQVVPDPPANVSFTLVQDVENREFKTARERLGQHNTDPVCAGCHKITDPMGLAMENFDGLGVYRSLENGAPIDASGNLDGLEFSDIAGLGDALAAHPQTPQCLVQRVYGYGTGQIVTEQGREWLDYMTKQFAADGYRFLSLLERMVTSQAFFNVVEPITNELTGVDAKASSSELTLQPANK